MSVKNFIPKLWATAVNRELEKSLVLVPRCNRNYEGLISAAGDTVKINGIGGIDTAAYTPGTTTITYQEIEDASTEFKIDQDYYFAFQLEDVDKAQATDGIFAAATLEAAYALGDRADIFIANKYSDAGTSITESSVTSSNVTSILTRIRRAFSENNVPNTVPIDLVVTPWFHEKMKLAKVITSTDNAGVINTGFLGNYWGFNIYESNNIVTTGSEGSLNSQIMAMTSRAITYASE